MEDTNIQVELELSDGSRQWATASLVDPMEEVGDLADGLKAKLSDITSGISPIVEDVRASLSTVDFTELTISLQLGLGVESGKVVSVMAKGSASAVATVTVTFAATDD